MPTTTADVSLKETQQETVQAQLSEPLLTSSPISEELPADEPESVPQPPSRNVSVILLYTFFVFAGRSIWNQNVLANFAALLMNGDPVSVGYLTAAMGISQLIVSFPVGYFADRYRRDSLCKIASFVGIFAVLVSLVALHYASYALLIIALCIWGAYWGCAQTSIAALFADSVPDGKRSRYFTTRSILIKVGQLAGPIVALALFFELGDQWTIKECSTVMTVGQLICVPAVFLLCLLNDDLVPGHHPETQLQLLESPLLPHQMGENDSSSNDEERAETSASSMGLGSSADNQQSSRGAGTDRDESYDTSALLSFVPFLSEERIIPTLVTLADVSAALASGMSVRYFAIFLVQNLHVPPVEVQILYIIAPIVQMALMKIIQYLASHYGRCKMAVVFKWTGISLMITMVLSYSWGFPIWVTCTLLILRTGFMNSPSALTRSVVMDHVKKEDRAKWSALESLNMFSWSGSAVLGGILVDKKGILFNFCFTAGLQFLSTMPLLLLAFCCRRRRHSS